MPFRVWFLEPETSNIGCLDPLGPNVRRACPELLRMPAWLLGRWSGLYADPTFPANAATLGEVVQEAAQLRVLGGSWDFVTTSNWA